MEPKAGYLERDHTADWELEAWGPDLPELLKQAAQGMYTLAGMRLKASPRARRTVSLAFHDAESLLVSFLSELLFMGEQEGLGFDDMQLRFDGIRLHAELEGAQIAGLDKEIKAVTYHKLAVRRTEDGLRVNVVFDV